MSSFYGRGGGGGASAKQIEKIKNHVIVSQYEPNIQQIGDIWIRVGNKKNFEVIYTKIITGRSTIQRNVFSVFCLEYGQPINIEENKQYFSVSDNVEIIENGVYDSSYALTMKIIDDEYDNDWEKRYNVNIKYKEYEETIQVIRFRATDSDQTFAGHSYLVTAQDNENIDFSNNFAIELIKRHSSITMIKNQVFHLKPVLYFDNEMQEGSSSLNLSANDSITNITNVIFKNSIDSYLPPGMSKLQLLQQYFDMAETQGFIPSGLKRQFGQIQVLEDGTLIAKKPGLCFPNFMNIIEFDGKNHFLSYFNPQTYKIQTYQLQNSYALDSIIGTFQILFVLSQEWSGFKLDGQSEISLGNQALDSFSWKVRGNGGLLRDISDDDLIVTIEDESIAEISMDTETGAPKIYCDNGQLSIDIQGKIVGDTKLLVTYNNETVEILIHVTES